MVGWRGHALATGFQFDEPITAMSKKADKFRRFAQEARKYLEKSVNEAEKNRWLKIAEGWERLAKDAESRPKQ